ncbi:VOC family protein [Streptomyces sp. NPDC057638]|uniref:VOC family protein n=1 Tax=Streptomyces sp. NPDC057638 TaxID=3346190 RepID=UPI0036C8E124
MAQATRHAPGTPCWVTLMVHGPEEIQEFYGELFGWEFVPGPDHLGPWFRVLVDGKEVGGIGGLPDDRHVPIAWTPYFTTDDADTTVETLRCSGGTVGVGPLDAAESGRLAIVTDPACGVFGLWQAAAYTGVEARGVPGTPVWHELLTEESASVLTFYQTVFGHAPQAAEGTAETEHDYVTLSLGGRPIAAVRGVGRALPHDRGTYWMTFFEVDDPDEAALRVRRLGGQVLSEPEDGPRGRSATVTDPEGAIFTVIRSPR